MLTPSQVDFETPQHTLCKSLVSLYSHRFYSKVDTFSFIFDQKTSSGIDVH